MFPPHRHAATTQDHSKCQIFYQRSYTFRLAKAVDKQETKIQDNQTSIDSNKYLMLSVLRN